MDLLAVLQGEGLAHPRVRVGDIFYMAQPADVFFDLFLAGPRTVERDLVSGIDQHGDDRAKGKVLVVGLDHLNDFRILAAFAGQGGAGLTRIAADVVAEGLGDVVEQSGAAGQAGV